jgi:hypothetical protein
MGYWGLEGAEGGKCRNKTTVEKLSSFFIFPLRSTCQEFGKGGRAKETEQPVMLQTSKLLRTQKILLNIMYLRIGKCKQYIFQIIENNDIQTRVKHYD